MFSLISSFNFTSGHDLSADQKMKISSGLTITEMSLQVHLDPPRAIKCLLVPFTNSWSPVSDKGLAYHRTTFLKKV